jgi:S-DNA-T family DNA segregation ATPase FtsK/SpoIIIE
MELKHLMGHGDLLFLDPEAAGLKRAQAVLMDDREIENIINYWQNAVRENQSAEGQSVEEEAAPWENLVPSISSGSDDLIDQAIQIVRKETHVSTSWLQRKMRIGFPRAARLMDELEERGIVGAAESGGREREVLANDNEQPEDDPDAF